MVVYNPPLGEAYQNGVGVTKSSPRTHFEQIEDDFTAVRANSGRVFSSRAAAVAYTQTALTSAFNSILTLEDGNLVWRYHNRTDNDPLFPTQPSWGIARVFPSTEALRYMGRTFSSRASAVSFGQANLPATYQIILTFENGDLVARYHSRTDDDPLFATQPSWGVFARFSSDGSGGAVPSSDALISNGATLHRLNAKLAALRVNPAGGTRLRVLVVGDSWSYRTDIVQALRDAFEDAGFALRGHGWQDVMGQRQLDGATFTKTGWTFTDASDNPASYPNGVGFDGHVITTSGTTATVTIGNLVATEMRVYSFGYGGTWRYRVDGGAWQTVTESTGGGLRVTTIGGLTDAGHSLEIDTTGNTGTVAIGGVYSFRAGTGVEVIKAGNASIDAVQMNGYLTRPEVAAQIADIQPDLIIGILGTNDYRRAAPTPSTFTTCLENIATAARSAVPDVGLLFIAPSQSDPTGQVVPLTDYAEALASWASNAGAEYANWTAAMGVYAETQPLGVWDDTVHLSAIGANWGVSLLTKNLIDI